MSTGLVLSATSRGRSNAPLVDPLQRRLSRLKRVVTTAARLHQEECGNSHRCVMVTLTYREEVDWKPYQITEFIDGLRTWFRSHDRPARYVWVLEKTKRGRPHYHVLVWVPRSLVLPKADKAGWWVYGMSRTEVAFRAVGYIAKYASKAHGESFKVKGCRLYGVGGLTSRRARNTLHYWRISRWLRDRIVEGDRVERVRFVGWLHKQTGEIFNSPWRIVLGSGGLRLFPVFDRQQVEAV